MFSCNNKEQYILRDETIEISSQLRYRRHVLELIEPLPS